MSHPFKLISPYKNVAYLKCEKIMFPLPPPTEEGTQPYDLLYKLNEIQMKDQMGIRSISPTQPLAFQPAPRLLPLTAGFNLQVALAQDGQSAQLDFVRSYHTGGETELVSVATCQVGSDTPHTLLLLTDLFHRASVQNRLDSCLRGTKEPPVRRAFPERSTDDVQRPVMGYRQQARANLKR